MRDRPGLSGARRSRVPVTVHWSLGVVAALLTTVLAVSQLPAIHPGASAVAYWAVAALTSTLFLASVVAHEVAHAVVARRFGVGVKGMTLWIFGGLTELDGDPPSPHADSVIAAAGPITSGLLALWFAAIAFAVGPGTLLGAALWWLAVTSMLLAVVNLLPGAPLDGGRILRATVWRRTGDRSRGVAAAARGGRAVGTGLIALGAVAVLAGDVAGLWVGAVGWFVLVAARAEQEGGGAGADAATGLLAEDVMDPLPMSCPQWWSAAVAVRSIPASHAGQPAFPVVDVDGLVVGAVTIGDLERAVRGGRAEVRVDKLRPPRAALAVVARRMPLDRVLRELRLHGHVGVVVDDGGRPVGVVTEAAAIRAVRWARAGGPARDVRPAPST